jgi:hypothetical protein
VKAAAARVVDEIPDTFDVRLTDFLLNTDSGGFDYEVSENDSDLLEKYQAYEKRTAVARQAVVRELLDLYPNSPDLLGHVEERIRRIRDAGPPVYPAFLLDILADLAPKTALELCTLISSDPTHELGSYLAPVFRRLRRAEPAELMSVVEGILDSGHAALCGAVAVALSGWPSDSWTDRDTALLRRLLLNEDTRLRELALQGLRPLAPCDRVTAVVLALGTDIGDSVPLGRALCELFVGPS